MSDFDEPITEWISSLKQGDEASAQQLWDQFFDRLVNVARRKLGGQRRVSDEEDVAISVFDTLCRGAVEGRFDQLGDRSDLWRLLMRITGQKCVDRLRREGRQKRGGGGVRGHSIFAGGTDTGPADFDKMGQDAPSPAFLMMLEEEHQRLLDALPDEMLRKIALLRMEGYQNQEISQQLGISLRSIERKLGLIRAQWSTELPE